MITVLFTYLWFISIVEITAVLACLLLTSSATDLELTVVIACLSYVTAALCCIILCVVLIGLSLDFLRVDIKLEFI